MLPPEVNAFYSRVCVCARARVQICGGVRSSSFRSDEIDQMVIDFVWSLRHHPRYAGAAFVVAIEGNMSYLQADRMAGIVMKDGLGPTIVLAEDGKNLGRYGVYTGHMEKCAYIEVIQALMIRGGLYWESKENFIGRFNRGADVLAVPMQKQQLLEFQNTMHDEMMNYRSERRDPKVRSPHVHGSVDVRRKSAGGRVRWRSSARGLASRTTRSCRSRSPCTGRNTRSATTRSWTTASATAGGVREMSCKSASPSSGHQRQQARHETGKNAEFRSLDLNTPMHHLNSFLTANALRMSESQLRDDTPHAVVDQVQNDCDVDGYHKLDDAKCDFIGRANKYYALPKADQACYEYFKKLILDHVDAADATLQQFRDGENPDFKKALEHLSVGINKLRQGIINSEWFASGLLSLDDLRKNTFT